MAAYPDLFVFGQSQQHHQFPHYALHNQLYKTKHVMIITGTS